MILSGDSNPQTPKGKIFNKIRNFRHSSPCIVNIWYDKVYLKKRKSQASKIRNLLFYFIIAGYKENACI